MKVVVVESPAKAKTINKYLGSGYEVLASYGHVRDLPPKDGSVRPDEDFQMSWAIDERSSKHVNEIAKAVKKADSVLLATDPDREGEAISWHVQKILEEKGVLKGKEISRVVFHEITRSAIQEAVANPRAVNKELVEAYLARRALDYLVGFTLSPVLWRKLPGSRSAGRVQSVSLRLICQRESEIEAFDPREYWTIQAEFTTDDGRKAKSTLTHIDGKKLDRFDLGDEAAAKAAVARAEGGAYTVAAIEKRQTTRNPAPPFTTSTLQQEASRRLHLPTSQTMRIAQKLYEGFEVDGETTGLISYMRTDSVVLSQEALDGARALIDDQYGKAYLPAEARKYQSKAKNAQEAHEAIRPTDMRRTPAEMAKILSDGDLKLYELIWKRTIASQMASAKIDQTALVFADAGGAAQFRATGSVTAFDGFLKLYQEGSDEAGTDDDSSQALPVFNNDERVEPKDAIVPEQHFTQPPPRYTEASLVKRMEELGIGRPSTYASILQVLQDRDYVRLESRRFTPEDRGRLVTSFLENFFNQYVQYDFTADLENKLDEVSNGTMEWRALLREFWTGFNSRVDAAKDLSITEVIDALDEQLGPHFFPVGEEGSDPRLCPACKEGRLGLRLGRHGAFVGCNNYPECKHTRPLVANGEDGGVLDGPKHLGDDPDTGLPVSLKRGPYGLYVQLGEPSEEKGAPKPKRASLQKGEDPTDLDLRRALALLSLPREIGEHPETAKMIKAGLGRFGPYLYYNSAYTSLPKDDDVLTVGINRAVILLAEAQAKIAASILRNLGDHPKGGEITIRKGRFGPFVHHGKVRASLAKGTDVDAITVEEALVIIEKKAAAPKKGAKGKAAAKPAAAKKAPAKKAPAKKAAVKKAPAKKPAAKKKAAPKAKP
ncbi:MAG: type I DNA topoisomerase, partial [Alphaproteobacteria bacterium]